MAPRPTTHIRLPLDLVRRIDKLRGLVPREAWVRDRLEKIVAAEEHKGTK